MKRILMSVILLGAVSSSLYAGCSGRYCTDVSIEKLSVLASGAVYIDTDGTEVSLTCTPVSGKYIVLSGPEKNTMYSTLLTAFTTKKKITIATENNGGGECTAQYVAIN